jgi:chloramphenicol-sensitive protein RarD
MNPVLLAVFAYACWGIVPLYWKLLATFPADEIINFRVLFSFLFLLPVLFWKDAFRGARGWRPKIMAALLFSGLCIGSNWMMYVWAVNHERVVDASLGYFLNPLMNVAIGNLFLGERLNKLQRVSILLAVIGIGVLLFVVGSIPWISLFLAVTFALYGFVRKQLAVPTLPATFFETLLLSLPSLAFLIYLFYQGQAHFPSATGREWLILSLCGAVTTIPLLAFAEAAKGMTFSSLGIFQFISPSLQFLLGVFVFREPFTPMKWLAFSFIWAGLAVFVFDLAMATRAKNLAASRGERHP